MRQERLCSSACDMLLVPQPQQIMMQRSPSISIIRRKYDLVTLSFLCSNNYEEAFKTQTAASYACVRQFCWIQKVCKSQQIDFQSTQINKNTNVSHISSITESLAIQFFITVFHVQTKIPPHTHTDCMFTSFPGSLIGQKQRELATKNWGLKMRPATFVL